MRHVTFGDLLRMFCEERLGPRSAGLLAERIGVDPSLVRRWLRQERVPSLDSPYIDQLAEALNLAPRERAQLRQAQIEALSVPQKLRRRPSTRQVRQILNTGGTPFVSPRLRAAAGPLQPAYYGQGALFRAFQDAIASLQPTDGPRPEILIALTGDWSGRSNTAETAQAWAGALSRLLEDGWDWSFVGGPSVPGANHQLVSRVIQLASLGPGRFTNYALGRDADDPGMHDLIVFPDFALVGLRLETRGVVDGALVIWGAERRALLCRLFEQLRRQADQTIAVYGPSDIQAIESIAALERLPGDRLHVKDGFRALTMPVDWLDGEMLRPRDGALSSEIFARILELDRARAAAFARSVRHDRWMDVASQLAIDELAREGRFRTPDLTQMVTLAPPQRAGFLRHLIGLLEHYPNYHLALVGPEQHHLLPQAAWAVKVGHGVIVRRPTAAGQFNTVILRQERFTDAFQAYFLEEVWGKIEPRHRDRSWVIGQLHAAIRRIP